MKTLSTNKNMLFAGLGVLLLAAVAVVAFFAGRASGSEEASASSLAAPEAAAAQAGGEREVLYWRAPMNPNETYDQPGKSAMGMDLVPVYAGEASGEGVVAIDPVTIQSAGVRTARVEVTPLAREVRTTGRFEASEKRTAAVSPKVGGWVETLHVDYEGDRVRRGQPLLEIYSPELVATQEEYLLALRNAERLGGGADAARLVDAARRRLSYWDISEEQIKHLKETGEPAKTLTLYAPATGTVSRKSVTEGERIQAGQTLMHLTDLSSLWLMLDVYEQDLGWVEVGSPVKVELPYAPGQTVQGRVDYLYDTLDETARTVRARVTVPNPGLRLKPGMYATARIEGRPTPPRPVVPSEAMVASGAREAVVLALGEGRFRPVEVETGVEADGQVQILSGLQGGEEVVTSAQFLIDSEARLQSALGAMDGGADAAGAGGAAEIDAATPPGATPETHATPVEEDPVQVVRITIGPEGFAPQRIALEAGRPARLVFTRQTESTCATAVQIPAIGIEATPLPMNEAVTIEFAPDEAGTFTFACGMDMLKGTLVVARS